MASSEWTAHVLCYCVAYFIQGSILGALGPAMRILTIGGPLNVTAFGPIFSASGLGAVLCTILSEYLLRGCLNYGHMVLTIMSFGLAIVVCLIPYVAKYGVFWLLGLLMIKGCCTSMINTLISQFCGVIQLSYPNLLMSSTLNYSFAAGTVSGPLLVVLFLWWQNDIYWMFWVIGLSNIIVIIMTISTDSPGNKNACEETAQLIECKEPQTFLPIFPSPFSGGMFLQKENDLSDKNEPGTLFTTIIAGIQFGLAAWLLEYVQSGEVEFIVPTLVTAAFWFSIMIGFFLFRKLSDISKQPGTVLALEAVLCALTSILLATMPHSFPLKVFGVVVYGLALSGCFTNCVEVLQNELSEAIAHRMSSLLIFGAVCGEVYIPMLMAFFMGDYSGAVYGEAAVMYITCVLSFCMVIVVFLLLLVVHRKKTRDRKPHLSSTSS